MLPRPTGLHRDAVMYMYFSKRGKNLVATCNKPDLMGFWRQIMQQNSSLDKTLGMGTEHPEFVTVVRRRHWNTCPVHEWGFMREGQQDDGTMASSTPASVPRKSPDDMVVQSFRLTNHEWIGPSSCLISRGSISSL